MPNIPAGWGRKSSSYYNNIHIVTTIYLIVGVSSQLDIKQDIYIILFI